MLGLAHLGYIPIPAFCSNHGQTPITEHSRDFGSCLAFLRERSVKVYYC